MICGLLPVKSPSGALQRLQAVLSPPERARLAGAMYREMLEKMMAVERFDRLVVASNDKSVLGHARRAGACVLEESGQNSHSRSADWAAARCLEMGARTLVFVPIDVPLATSGELDSLAAAGRQLGDPGLIIVPSQDGSGTNALVRTPPGVVTSCFGTGSFEAHIAQAKEKAVPVEVRRPPGIVFDVDTPEDLLTLRLRARGGETLTYLLEIKAFERAEHYLQALPRDGHNRAK